MRGRHAPLVALLLAGLAGTQAWAIGAVVSATGPVTPARAPDDRLYLVRYDIPPGTRLPPHHHQGIQIGLVAAGTLTYHVLTGEVPVYRHGADGKPELVRMMGAGDVAPIASGEWLVETADVKHWGANEGQEPLVIYSSALLEAGAPLATLDPP